MKNWLQKNYKTLIIAAFLIPIFAVAVVSISHVTKWYGISNPVSWAIYLSIGIEIAALSALAAISANMGKKVYFPFAIVTVVQFIGNIYFAYSYIDITSKSFLDWVDLVRPLLEFTGVDPTDMVGHKRFLAFFAGGMLPIISLSFLHMLVKFTEEDKKKEGDVNNKEENVVDAKEIVAEVSRLRLSDDDLKVLEEHLLNPKEPNEELKKAAENYKKYKGGENEPTALANSGIKEKELRDNLEVVLKSKKVTSKQIDDYVSPEQREKILSEMTRRDQELGLYDEPHNNPLIKEPSKTPQNASEMMITTNEDVINSIPSDEQVSDMDLNEEQYQPTPEEERQNISTIEPSEGPEEKEFSTITPETENIFQEESVEEQFDGFVPEPFATPEEVEKYGLDDVEKKKS
jgi:hypothetical protein